MIDGIKNALGKAGTAIGEHYAKQGTSWDEVQKLPSSGGFGSGYMSGFAKTGYDNYMAQQAPASTPSNMIQKSGTIGESGLAASGIDQVAQPTLTSGIQNSAADSNMFGNMTNGLGENRFGAVGLAASGNQQNGYQILGAPRII